MRARWWVGGAVGLSAFAIATVVAAPMMLSSAVVKERVSARLEQMLGRKVRLGGVPTVSFSPYLSVGYTDVAVEGSGSPLLVADRMNVGLDFIAALRGRPQVKTVHLLRPRFDLPSAVAAFEQPPIVGPAEAAPLFDLTIENGTVLLSDGEAATSVSGALRWNIESQPLAIDLTGRWRNEPISLSGRIERMAAFMSKAGESAAELVLNVGDAEAKAAGTLTFSETASVAADGELRVSLPSPARVVDWSGVALPTGLEERAAAFLGKGTWRDGRLSLQEVQASLGEDRAAGRMDLRRSARAEGPAAFELDGTLAFDTMTLNAFDLSGERAVLPMLAALEALAVDVRISAKQVVLRSGSLRDVAVGLISSGGKASLDLGAGSWAGGSLTGSATHTVSNGQTVVKARAGGLDLAAISTGLGGLPISATGQADIVVDARFGPASDDRRIAVTASSPSGNLVGFDAVRLENMEDGSARKPLAAPGTATPYEGLEVDLLVARDKTQLSTLSFVSGEQHLQIAGTADLVRGTLEAEALISPRKVAPEVAGTGGVLPVGADAATRTVFIGGTLEAPMMSSRPISGTD